MVAAGTPNIPLGGSSRVLSPPMARLDREKGQSGQHCFNSNRTPARFFTIASVVLVLALLCPAGVSSFAEPRPARTRTARRCPARPTAAGSGPTTEPPRTWSPQDLTRDNPGFPPIPDEDYIKLYQEKPELWPVEFFLVAYRRVNQPQNNRGSRTETQVLVRKSANGTSRYGLGTGVPATRWVLSTAEPPRGYQWSEPATTLGAHRFPEFDPRKTSWTYRKIDLRENAFGGGSDAEASLRDPALEAYARAIREHLRTELSERMREEPRTKDLASWEDKRTSVVQAVLEHSNSVAAIQGTLRMSGIFATKPQRFTDDKSGGGKDSARYVDPSHPTGPLDPASLARSVQIHTMFPQMPDPMPLPSTPPEALRNEIVGRSAKLRETGRDPHKDRYGRTFTHISTSNVSNTIHGVYLTLDLTELLPGGTDDKDPEIVPPALDLFGTRTIPREWKSLEELKVLASEGDGMLSTEDPKPTFISGFIVRQLVKDGIIDIHDKAPVSE